MSMQAATLEILEKADLLPRHDLRDLRNELKVDMRDLRNELKVDMAEHKTELVRWVFLCILGQTAMLLGAGYFFVTQYTA